MWFFLFLFVKSMIKEKTLLWFLMTAMLPCANVVGESRRSVPYIKSQWLLLIIIMCFLETNPQYLHLLAPQKHLELVNLEIHLHSFAIQHHHYHLMFLCNLCRCWFANSITFNIDVLRVQWSSHIPFPFEIPQSNHNFFDKIDKVNDTFHSIQTLNLKNKYFPSSFVIFNNFFVIKIEILPLTFAHCSILWKLPNLC
jgi:hypothetical protein